MSDPRTIAIVVVMYNSADLLADLVASLHEGLTPHRGQLIGVDNASSDGSAQVLRDLAPESVVVETGRNGGYAAGVNAGVAAAGPHDAVLVLNPDVRLHPGCVDQLVAALATEGTGVAVPRLVDGDGDLIESMRREPTVLRTLGDAVLGATRAGRYDLLGEVVTRSGPYAERRRVDWAEGSTQLIDRACWHRCGPWDESYFLYSEETDFGLRVRDAGLATIFVPGAVATHLEGDSGASTALWPLLVANRLLLYRRRHGLLASAAFWVALMLREGSRAALGRPTNRAAVRALTSPRRLRQARGPEWFSV